MISQNFGNTDSRAGTLDSRVSETRKKIMRKTDLTLVRRSKIQVSSFGAVGYIL